MDESVKRAYENVLNTKDGQMVFQDLLENFNVISGVYKFQGGDTLSDLAFRDGQRNSGIYIYSTLSSISPEKTSHINAAIMQKQNDAISNQKKVIKDE